VKQTEVVVYISTTGWGFQNSHTLVHASLGYISKVRYNYSVTKAHRIFETPIFEGVARKDPGGLIFLDRFLPHRTRSAHLLCTLTTTPLPVALLAIATRGAVQARLLVFIKHGNTVTSACLSVRLVRVYHVQNTLYVNCNFRQTG
jgi:hypothetical protein